MGNSYSNHSKSTRKGSSNNINNNKATISNNKNHLFISGPEEFFELLNDLNISADNPYYKRKKKKIRKKVKNKVKNKGKNKKKYRSENHEKTLYKKFREFLNKNMYYIININIYIYFGFIPSIIQKLLHYSF